MKTLKNSMIITLVFVMIFASFAGCKKATYIEEESMISGTSEQTENSNNEQTENSNNEQTTESQGSQSNTTSSKEDKGQQLTTSNNSSASSDGKGNTSAKIQDNIKIKKGNTPIEKNVDYKGKKIVFTTPWPPQNSFIKEFEKTYNCEIDMRTLDFNLYSQQAAALVNSGTQIDIGYIYEAHYPTVLISGLWKPLQDIITTADLLDDGDNKAAPLVDLEKSRRFVWNNNLYATTYYYSSYTGVILYNKKIIKDMGAKDPRDYYKAGKWNYENFLSWARSVTDPDSDIYFGTTEMYSGWLKTNNTGYIKFKNGVPTENMSDPALYDALKLVRDMAVGKNHVLRSHQNAKEAFLQGKAVGYKNYISEYKNLKDKAKTSEVFGKNSDNVGMILLPTGPNNTKKIPTTVPVDGYGASVGSKHPEAAILWTKLLAKNQRKSHQENWGLNDSEWNEFVEEPLKQDIHRSYSGFATSSTNMTDVGHSIESKVYLGLDIASLLNKFRQQVRNCIDVSMKEQG